MVREPSGLCQEARWCRVLRRRKGAGSLFFSIPVDEKGSAAFANAQSLLGFSAPLRP